MLMLTIVIYGIYVYAYVLNLIYDVVRLSLSSLTLYMNVRACLLCVIMLPPLLI